MSALELAFVVRNHPQELSQPFAMRHHMAVPLAIAAKVVAFGGLERREFPYNLCGRRGTFCDILTRWRVSKVTACDQVQHFRRVVLRGFCALAVLHPAVTRCKCCKCCGRRETLWHFLKIDGGLARNIDFEWFWRYQILGFMRKLAGKLDAWHWTLHTLHSTHYTLAFPTPNFALQTPHFTLYTPRSTVWTLHSIHSTFYTPRSVLYSPHSTPHTLHFTLHTSHCAIYTPHFTLRTPRSTLRTLHSTHTLHSRLLTVRSTLHMRTSALHTWDHLHRDCLIWGECDSYRHYACKPSRGSA